MEALALDRAPLTSRPECNDFLTVCQRPPKWLKSLGALSSCPNPNLRRVRHWSSVPDEANGMSYVNFYVRNT